MPQQIKSYSSTDYGNSFIQDSYGPVTSDVEPPGIPTQISYWNTTSTYGLSFAATELQYYIEEMTGQHLDIVTSRVDPPAFFLVQSDLLPPGGYTISTESDGSVWITGNSFGCTNPPVQAYGRSSYYGVLTGVYEYLRQHGCEWYWPDSLGTIVPTNVTLRSVNCSGVPFFDYAGMNNGPPTYAGVWAVRMGMRDKHGWPFDHNWRYIMGMKGPGTDGHTPWCDVCPPDPDDPFGRCGHPEYMAMVPGPTGTHMDYYGLTNYNPIDNRICTLTDSSAGQICTWNPGTIQAVADYAIDWLQKNPNTQAATISPNDSGGFCECLECQKLDGAIDRSLLFGDINGDGNVDATDDTLWESLSDELKLAIPHNSFVYVTYPSDDHFITIEEDFTSSGSRRLTDRMIVFYNEVAEKVSQTLPTRKVSGFVYGLYKFPPLREVLIHPNLMLCLVLNSARTMSDSRLEQDNALIEYWAEKAPGKVGLYDIGCWLTAGMMQPMKSSFMTRLRKIRESGFMGCYMYIGGAGEDFGLESYLFGRFVFNPDFDDETIIAKYYNDLYGGAAVHVRSFYELMESRRDEIMKGYLTAQNPVEVRGVHPTLGALAYACVDTETLDGLSTAAEALIPDVDESTAARITRFADYWQFTKGASEALLASAELNEDPTSIEAWTRYKTGIDMRKEMMNTGTAYWIAVKARALWEENYLSIENLLSTTSGLYTLPMDAISPTVVYDQSVAFEANLWSYNEARMKSHEVIDNVLIVECLDNPKTYALINFNLPDDVTPGDETWVQFSLDIRIEGSQGEVRNYGNVDIYFRYYINFALYQFKMVQCTSYDCVDWLPLSSVVRFPTGATTDSVSFVFYGGGTISIRNLKVRLYEQV